MRIPALPLIASIALFAAPALAQTTGTPANQPNQGMENQNQEMGNQQGSQGYGAAQQSNQQSAAEVGPTTQQELEQSLLRTGFRNVMVEPQTYVIHAQAPDGSRIAMVVGPDRVTGIIMGSSASGPNRSVQGGSSNWNQGGMNRPGNEANEPAQNGSSNWNQGGNQGGMNR